MAKTRWVIDYSLTRLTEDNFGGCVGKASLGQACIEVKQEDMSDFIKFIVDHDLIESKKARVKITNE